MRRKAILLGISWRLIVALILALCLLTASSGPVLALSLGDYFSFSYSVEFSKVQITGNEVFYATVEATADCTNNLPLPYSLASEAEITANIVAEHQASGTRVTLVSSYTLTIKPFPTNAGDTEEVHKVLSLQFPSGSQSGTYTVMAELIEARVKALLIWRTVTEYLPASQTADSVITYASSRQSGGGGGAGGAPEEDEEDQQEEQVEVSEEEPESTPTVTVVTQSVDGRCELTIPEGTRGLNQEGDPLTEIAVNEIEGWLSPAENYGIVSAVYDLAPDGATFDPPVILTITYDESLMPERTAEENLVIAIWDEATDEAVGEWVVLAGSTVDPENNTVTAPVSHFTAFTVLAYVSPATFVTSELSITPAAVDIGQEVTIRSLINNAGDLAGSYTAILRIDGAVVATKEVSVEAGATEEVTFVIASDVAGTYTVAVDGLSGTYVVSGPATFVASELSVAPVEADTGQEVTIRVQVTNTSDVAGSYKVTLMVNDAVIATRQVSLEGGASQEVAFTLVKDVPGTYAVAVDGLSAILVVTVPPEPTTGWPLSGIIAAGTALALAVVLAIVLTVVYRRRRA